MMKVQCCVCHAVKASDGTWIPCSGIIEASHTYCPTCAAIERAKIVAYRAARMVAA